MQQAGSGNAMPPGPYMLFVNREVNGCLKPSKAAQVRASASGLISPTSGCLARRSPIGPRNIGRVRLGRTRARLLAEPRLAKVGPARKTAKAYRYCVKGGKGRVMAVFGAKTKIDLVTTTGALHGNREVRPGSTRKMRKAFPAPSASAGRSTAPTREPAPDRRAQGQGALLRRRQQAHPEEQEAAPRLPAPGRLRSSLRAGPGGLLAAAPPAPARPGPRPRSPTARTRPRSSPIDDVSQDVPGLDVAIVRDQAARLQVTNRTGREYRVLAKGGDPFIRIGPRGVLANVNSVTWYRSGNPDGVAQPPKGAAWAARRGGRGSPTGPPGPGSTTACTPAPCAWASSPSTPSRAPGWTSGGSPAGWAPSGWT